MNNQVIVYWKAAFIEDALELHLARKKMFAMIIKVWSSEREVRKVFRRTVPNGKVALVEIRKAVKEIK